MLLDPQARQGIGGGRLTFCHSSARLFIFFGFPDQLTRATSFTRVLRPRGPPGSMRGIINSLRHRLMPPIPAHIATPETIVALAAKPRYWLESFPPSHTFIAMRLN
jgi:hypothetical protein